MKKIYNEEINKIKSQYGDMYRSLNNLAKQKLISKRYYVGSDDVLGYYEPELTDYLQDPRSRKGHFIGKKPVKGNYFEYWYDVCGLLIKIKYIDYDREEDNYDVIVIDESKTKLYVFYGYDFYNGNISLQDFYVLKYNDSGLLKKINKFIYDKFTYKYTLMYSDYVYIQNNLIEATVVDVRGEHIYKFQYNDRGYMSSFICSDGFHVYNQSVERNIIERFEKFDLFHFSP